MDMDAAVRTHVHRVLIVDDEITIRIALRRFFTRLGWSVEEASNGESALHLLSNDASQDEAPRFSVVVSDLRMPGLNGMEMYDQLKVRHPDVLRRLIFSTGDLVSEEAATFVRNTDCVVLQKPFELAALREVVERVVAADHP
ncbi:MAG: response regulator [Gemmatimonadetes bacterium]|jgi:DNA-binding NtrC family response regulator|nr:response regulator [Gemmatimonadota bacterium]MBK8646394.1 response regulator [Gemmatimonadota bacterium]MBK9407341.1 response regulator [Gemmatimonadota bacterium]MBK9977589.1 response regulator [Gemmatimonadota bacterium]